MHRKSQVPLREDLCSIFGSSCIWVYRGGSSVNMSPSTEELPAWCTALMFKLNCKLSQQEFLWHLHRWCGYAKSYRPYDFVHLPWCKLVVVNFVDAEACAYCYAKTKKLLDSGAGCVAGVRSAAQHGLKSNLADFYSRVQRTSKRVPLVFDNGNKVDLLQAASQLNLQPLAVTGQVQTDVELKGQPSLVHLDHLAVFQKDAWACLCTMKDVRILIDL